MIKKYFDFRYFSLLESILKVNPDFAPLDGLSSLDMAWEIEIPKHQHQLKRYGEILSHCVGGYGSSINSGRSVIVAVYSQGFLKYTLEFVSDGTCRKVGNDFHSNYRCNQFYGFRNSSPSNSDRTVVLDMFQQAKLINWAAWWGEMVTPRNTPLSVAVNHFHTAGVNYVWDSNGMCRWCGSWNFSRLACKKILIPDYIRSAWQVLSLLI